MWILDRCLNTDWCRFSWGHNWSSHHGPWVRGNSETSAFLWLECPFSLPQKGKGFSQIKHWIVRNDLRYCLLLLNFSLSSCDYYVLKYSVVGWALDFL